MKPNTRAMIAAASHAVVIGKKVAGVYDHAAGRHLRIAAECRGGRLQGLDGDRTAKFGGLLPDIHDAGDRTSLTLEAEGATTRGYDRDTKGFYTANVAARQVQLFDHALTSWFTYDIQVVDAEPTEPRAT